MVSNLRKLLIRVFWKIPWKPEVGLKIVMPIRKQAMPSKPLQVSRNPHISDVKFNFREMQNFRLLAWKIILLMDNDRSKWSKSVPFFASRSISLFSNKPDYPLKYQNLISCNSLCRCSTINFNGWLYARVNKFVIPRSSSFTASSKFSQALHIN